MRKWCKNYEMCLQSKLNFVLLQRIPQHHLLWKWPFQRLENIQHVFSDQPIFGNVFRLCNLFFKTSGIVTLKIAH